MSQRPKGPGGPPTSSTIPSWSLPHLPELGLVLQPLLPKYAIFLHSKAPPRRLC